MDPPAFAICFIYIHTHVNINTWIFQYIANAKYIHMCGWKRIANQEYQNSIKYILHLTGHLFSFLSCAISTIPINFPIIKTRSNQNPQHQYVNFFNYAKRANHVCKLSCDRDLRAQACSLLNNICLFIGAIEFTVLPRAHRVAEHQLRLAGDDFAGSTSRACDHRAPSIEQPPSLRRQSVATRRRVRVSSCFRCGVQRNFVFSSSRLSLVLFRRSPFENCDIIRIIDVII